MADPGDLRLRLLWPLLRSANAKKSRGGSRGAWGKARLLFVAAGARGGALPRYQSWAAVAARPGAGGSELRGDEDGADRRGRAVSVCEEGSGGGCGQAVWLGRAARGWAAGEGEKASGPKFKKGGKK